MSTETVGDITELILRWRQGDRAALDTLVAETYPNLHGIADAFLRRDAKCRTLQATGLVNELYLILHRQRTVTLGSRQDFYSFAAHLTRLILLKRARDRAAAKRDGVRVPLTDSMSWVDAAGADMLDLDRALEELNKLDPRKVRVLELTAFLGCTAAETAEILEISRATVERDLQFTRAWLYEQLHGMDPATGAA